MKRRLPSVVYMLIFVFILALPVCASEIDASGKTDLQIHFPHHGTPFELYRVATADSNGTYKATAAFRNLPVDLSSGQADASVLESYVRLWELEPTVSNAVGWGDYANFEQLDEGLYLIISRHITTQGTTFKAQPLLIALPVYDPDDNTTIRQFSISPKVIMIPPHTDDFISQKVMKVWKHQDDSNPVPDEVTIHLLCDGKVYDTQVLNDGNNWTYRWDNLEPDHMWSVAEEPVKDYLVSVMKSGITFVVTNTYHASAKPTEPTDPTDPTTPNPTDPPSDGGGTPSLPQTGVLWWPVPILTMSGLVFFVAGWQLRRREEDV